MDNPTRQLLAVYVRFAEIVAKKTGKRLEDTLLTDSPLYARFGLGGEPDADHPVWKEYVAGLQSAPLVDWTYHFYLRPRTRQDQAGPAPRTANGSCFGYEIDGATIKLHFENNDTSAKGPFCPERIEFRKQDLKNMFAEIREKHPDARTVRGGSWLGSFAPLRRLMPKAFVDAARPSPTVTFTGTGIWGQFVNGNGFLKHDIVDQFFEKLETVDADHLADAFPFKRIESNAPIEAFYAHFGVTPPDAPGRR